MNDFSQPLPGERTIYFSEDGLTIVLFPLQAGQPAKLLRHADGLLRAYLFTPEDANTVREILRGDGVFRVFESKLVFWTADQTSISFAIPPHAAGLEAPGVLGGHEAKVLLRLPKPDPSSDSPRVD